MLDRGGAVPIILAVSVRVQGRRGSMASRIFYVLQDASTGRPPSLPTLLFLVSRLEADNSSSFGLCHTLNRHRIRCVMMKLWYEAMMTDKRATRTFSFKARPQKSAKNSDVGFLKSSQPWSCAQLTLLTFSNVIR